MIVVVDASVAAKCFLASDPAEDDGDIALQILRDAVDGTLDLYQPPHFAAEVSSVLARLKPKQALLDVRDLLEIDFRRVDDAEIYAIATALAIQLDHHVFDTLYHAVALATPDATLITADRRYYDKAHHEGRVMLLSRWRGT